MSLGTVFRELEVSTKKSGLLGNIFRNTGDKASAARMESKSLCKPTTAEGTRLKSSFERESDWKNWGPYVSDRAWGTVREDYSGDGSAWAYFPHEHARSRAYRWNEDGIGVQSQFTISQS